MGWSLGSLVHLLLLLILCKELKVVQVDPLRLSRVFSWNGGHIPPSSPYVGPLLTYVGMSFGNTNSFGHNFHTTSQVSIVSFMSSPFSLFSGGIHGPMSQTPVSTRVGQTKYHAQQTSNPLDLGWNSF